jgi:hypothetical protein
MCDDRDCDLVILQIAGRNQNTVQAFGPTDYAGRPVAPNRDVLADAVWACRAYADGALISFGIGVGNPSAFPVRS